MTHLAATLAATLNRAIKPLGIRGARAHDWHDPKNFLPFDDTVTAARKAGLSIADYVDIKYNVEGATQKSVDRMADCGVFSAPIQTVVEIGPGSGRYLDKILRRCDPSRYEIYETAKPWADYLKEQYGVIQQPADGRSLSATPDASADFVQAHKVFVTTTFLTTCAYWLEMLRVSRQDAHIVFDIVTEDCMDWGDSEIMD